MKDKEINRRIRLVRQEHHLKQDEFAKALGNSEQIISRIESGAQNLDAKFLYKLKEKFGVSSDYILFGEVSGQDSEVELDTIRSQLVDKNKIIQLLEDKEQSLSELDKEQTLREENKEILSDFLSEIRELKKILDWSRFGEKLFTVKTTCEELAKKGIDYKPEYLRKFPVQAPLNAHEAFKGGGKDFNLRKCFKRFHPKKSTLPSSTYTSTTPTSSESVRH